jgi:hypothetical protein
MAREARPVGWERRVERRARRDAPANRVDGELSRYAELSARDRTEARARFEERESPAEDEQPIPRRGKSEAVDGGTATDVYTQRLRGEEGLHVGMISEYGEKLARASHEAGRVRGKPTMRLRLPAASGLESPTGGGWRPRDAGCLWVLLLAVAAGCSPSSADQVIQPVAVGMTSSIAPYYSDGQITLYQVETPVALPVRKPTSADLQGLGRAPKGTPYPRSPFLRVDDESVEVHFVLSNLDGATHYVWLLIDPWNEFVRWKPGVTVVSDEETVPNNGYDKEYILPPKSRIEGTITSDDMKEVATKLASVQNFLASPQGTQAASAMIDNSLDPTQICNNIFDYQNRSNSTPPDLFYTPWIPPVVAGLTGFDLGLRIESDEGGTGGGNVAVEVTVEVQDLNGDRFVPQDTNDPEIGTPPKTLSPPSARF